MHINRIGKIARLPRAVRDELNQRIDDGEAGMKLLGWLNELPAVEAIVREEFAGKPILKQNLSAWRQGGYRDWRMQQEARELTERWGEDEEEVSSKQWESKQS